jgi:hypothetical protein
MKPEGYGSKLQSILKNEPITATYLTEDKLHKHPETPLNFLYVFLRRGTFLIGTVLEHSVSFILIRIIQF